MNSPNKEKVINDVLVERLYRFMGDMTQYALAEKSGVPYSTVKSIFQKKTKGVELKTIILFAHGLGITPWELIEDNAFLAENLNLN